MTPDEPTPGQRRSSLMALGTKLGRGIGSLRHLGHWRHLYRSHKNLTPDAAEDGQLEQMLEQLSEEEIDIAARSSYSYLKNPNNEQVKIQYAKQYALRFLRSKRHNQEKALQKLKQTLQFRKELDMDGLRLAFETDRNSDYREPLLKQLRSGTCKVQGYDREGRATYIFIPRHVQGHDAEWTVKQHVYTLERAIACSTAPDKTVNAVVDFNGFSALRHAPPTGIGKEFMLTLRNHYAGSIHQIFLMDAPLAFNAIWNVFKPFIGSQTRSKIHFCKSKHRNGLVSRWYEPEQAGSFMMPGGTKNREFDADEYLFRTLFNEAFDE